jgi:DNA invertase Pin-like site-specific DNA recombinase
MIEAGVPECNIHADIDVSRAAGVATRNGWRSVDSKLKHGDILVEATLDRIGRRSLDVTGEIYDLVNRGVRLGSSADNEAWAK